MKVVEKGKSPFERNRVKDRAPRGGERWRSVVGGATMSLGSWSGNGTPSLESIAVLKDSTAPVAMETRATLREEAAVENSGHCAQA